MHVECREVRDLLSQLRSSFTLILSHNTAVSQSLNDARQLAIGVESLRDQIDCTERSDADGQVHLLHLSDMLLCKLRDKHEHASQQLRDKLTTDTITNMDCVIRECDKCMALYERHAATIGFGAELVSACESRHSIREMLESIDDIRRCYLSQRHATSLIIALQPQRGCSDTSMTVAAMSQHEWTDTVVGWCQHKYSTFLTLRQ